MKQVCIKKCQIKLTQGITYVSKGSVIEYPAEHKCLVPLETMELDFTEDSRETLMEAKWSFEQANDAIMAAYQKPLVKEEGTKKSEIVEQIMDIRFRSLNIDPNKVVE